MRLLRLKLKNFRQHRDTTIDFEEGMTAIVGTNGSGKSTLLEAITFALYGEKRDDIGTLRFFWTDERECSVTLSFELDGRRYEVVRTLTKASLTDTSEDRPVVRASGIRDTGASCERLLGLTFEQFINSFCAQQKNLAFLSFSSGAAQQEQISRMLGYDRLERAEVRAKELKKASQNEAEGLRQGMADESALRLQRQEAGDRLKIVEAQIREETERRVKLAALLVPAAGRRKQAETYLNLLSGLAELRGQGEGLRKGMDAAERELAEAKRAEDQRLGLETPERQYLQALGEEKACQELREQDRLREAKATDLARLEADEKKLAEEVAALGSPDLGAVEAAFAERKAAEQEAERALRASEKSWKDEQVAAQGAVSAASTNATNLRAALEKAEKMVADGVCPECGQKTPADMAAALEERRSALAVAEEERGRAAGRVAALADKPASVTGAQEALATAHVAVDAAHEASRRAAVLASQSKSLTDSLAQTLAKRQQIAKELESMPARYEAARHETLKAQLKELEPPHEAFLRLAGAAAKLAAATEAHALAKRDFEAAKAAHAELKAHAEATGFAKEEDAKAAVAEHESLAGEERECAGRLQSAEQAREAAQAMLRQAEQALERNRAARERLKELESSETLNGVLAREMKVLREQLNALIRPDIVLRASDNLGLLTNGRYDRLELDDKFKATVMDEGIGKKVISGGEEDVVALALRLALSELIQERQGRPLSLLILDEVFGSLDADRRQSVLERLASLKGRFRQIIVISHIEDIHQVADRCVYLERDAASRATVVRDAPSMPLPELALEPA